MRAPKPQSQARPTLALEKYIACLPSSKTRRSLTSSTAEEEVSTKRQPPAEHARACEIHADGPCTDSMPHTHSEHARHSA